LHLLSWVRTHDLIPQVPIVQLSIRMLVPPHSALLEHEDVDTWLGPLDPENYSYNWEHPDQRMDKLHIEIAALAETTAGDDPYLSFSQVESLASNYAGVSPPKHPARENTQATAPQLTEHWFC
ncbi:MAG: radical SAM protein, partial [Chloroflexota bacterium]